jgi:hypothetical protein
MQVGYQDRIDSGGADPPSFHRDEAGGSAVDQEPEIRAVHVNTGLSAAAATERIPTSQKLNHYLGHIALPYGSENRSRTYGFILNNRLKKSMANRLS